MRVLLQGSEVGRGQSSPAHFSIFNIEAGEKPLAWIRLEASEELWGGLCLDMTTAFYTSEEKLVK